MARLIDSNILLRFIRPSDPDYAQARAALLALRLRKERLCYTPQNLSEFWNVCTRPATARGGFGLSLAETDRKAQIIERRFMLLPDNLAVHTEWRRLIVAHAVLGKQVYDARLVASMRIHGISHILSFDAGDFARYPGITAVHPKDV